VVKKEGMSLNRIILITICLIALVLVVASMYGNKKNKIINSQIKVSDNMSNEKIPIDELIEEETLYEIIQLNNCGDKQ